MGRPSQPLIDPASAIATALELIDGEGLEAFSMRRLGGELGVSGAALYYHFDDKDDVLDGVKLLVLREARALLPRSQRATWQELLITSVSRYRKALAKHPNAAPLMLPGRTPRSIGLPYREGLLQMMEEAGVPLRHRYAIIDSAECLAFGSAFTNPQQLPLTGRFDADETQGLSHLRVALKGAPRTADKLFSAQLIALLHGWAAFIADEEISA